MENASDNLDNEDYYEIHEGQFQMEPECQDSDEEDEDEEKFATMSNSVRLMFEECGSGKRKKQANPENWKKNINKKLKMQGQPYETKKGLQQPKIPKEVDCRNCKFRCTLNFTEEDRKQICASFWKLDYCRKKDFILMNVKSLLPKRRRPRTGTGNPRTNSKIFHFFKKGNSVRVCQSFFTRTLNICSQSIKKAFEHKNPYTNFFDGSDSRGKHPPKNKSTENQLNTIKTVLENIPYDTVRRKNNIRKIYKDGSLTMQKIFNIYKNHCESKDEKHLSIKTFVRIFKTEFGGEYGLNAKKEMVRISSTATAPTIKEEVEEEEETVRINELFVINPDGEKIIVQQSDIIEEDQDVDADLEEQMFDEDSIIEDNSEANRDTIIYDPQTVTYTTVPTYQVRVVPVSTHIIDGSSGQIQFL